MFDILVAGEINPDLVLSGDVVPEFGQVEKLVDTATLALGSSSAIFACGAARLGLKMAFIGVCGDDVFGRFMMQQMQSREIYTSPVIIDPAVSTGLSVILVRGADRAILTFPGSMSTLRSEQVSDSLLRTSRHLHVASYFLQTSLQPGLRELFSRARQLGLSTSLDTNWDPSGHWKGVAELLELVDVFFPNANEALALSGAGSLEEAARELGRKCTVVAIKRGSEGALALQDGKILHLPALPVKVVDTVGAGDSFDAGFLCGWLNGWPLERSLSLAVVCGSLSTQGTGGIIAQPSLEEALRNVKHTG